MISKRIESRRKELERIRAKNNGILNPEDVVKEAKNPKNCLHDYFLWEDNEAAHQYRLWQARQMIRIFVEVLKPETTPVNVYVSLSGDRRSGLGYRAMVDVMSDLQLREMLLLDAIRDMESFKDKYKALEELSKVFEEMAHVMEKYSQTPKLSA